MTPARVGISTISTIMAVIGMSPIGCQSAADGDVHFNRHKTINNQVIVVEAVRRLRNSGWIMDEGQSWQSIVTAALLLLPPEGFEKREVYKDGWGRDMIVARRDKNLVVRSLGFNGRDEGGRGDDIEAVLP